MTTIIFTRHAETVSNKLQKGQGSQHNTDLTINGIENTRAKCEILAKLNPEVIVTSESQRCKKTAKIIDDCLNTNNIISDSRLDGINLGNFTGSDYAVINNQLSKMILDSSLALPQGESLDEVRRRVIECLHYITDEYKGKTVLVIGHAIILKIVNIHFRNLSIDLLLDTNMPNEYISYMRFDQFKLKEYVNMTDSKYYCL